MHISSQGWDGHVCTWVSKSPVGGATIGWVAAGSPQLTLPPAGQSLPAGETEVGGVGVRAVGRVVTGLAAPLAPTEAFLLVDLGHGGMTVHLSGPAVTVDEAVTLAKDVLGA